MSEGNIIFQGFFFLKKLPLKITLFLAVKVSQNFVVLCRGDLFFKVFF